MRDQETYLHSLPFYQMLDRINDQLSQAISLARKVEFSPEDLAWFRQPVKEVSCAR